MVSLIRLPWFQKYDSKISENKKNSELRHINKNPQNKPIINSKLLFMRTFYMGGSVQSKSLCHTGLKNSATQGWMKLATQSWNCATQDRNCATQDRNCATQDRNCATQDRNCATQDRNCATQSWNCATQGWNCATQDRNGATQGRQYATQGWMKLATQSWNCATQDRNCATQGWQYATQGWNCAIHCCEYDSWPKYNHTGKIKFYISLQN